MTTRRLLLCFAAWWLAASGQAAFRDMDGGARPASLGGAFTAVANDADAPSWNAAGPGAMKTDHVGFMYAQPLSGIDGVSLAVNSLAWVHPSRRGGALSLAYHGFEADGLYSEKSLLLGYAHRLDLFLPRRWTNLPELYGGANVRYLRSGFTLDSQSAADPVFSDGGDRDTFGVDFGLMAKWERLSLGLAAKNVNEPSVGFAERDRVRAETRLGAAYKTSMRLLENSLWTADLWFREGETGVRLGWENWFLDDRAALRLGWNDTALGVGLGWRLPLGGWDAGIDYAYLIPVQVEDDGSGTHRISLVARYGPRKK